MNWPELTLAQEKAEQGVYAVALGGFIQYLAADLEGHRARHRERQRAERNALREDAAHGRTADMGGELLATWDLIRDYAQEIGAYSEEELEHLTGVIRGGILETLAEQGAYLQDADPVDRFFNLVSSLLSSGAAHLAAPDGSAPDNAPAYGWREHGGGPYGTWQPQGRRIGWVDTSENQIWLHPDTVYAAVKQLAETQGSTLPTTKQTLWKRLRERGLIVPGGSAADQRNTHKKTLGGVRQNVIELSLIGVLKTGTTGTLEEEERQGRGSERPGSEKNRDSYRDTHQKTGTLHSRTEAEAPENPSPDPEHLVPSGADDDVLDLDAASLEQIRGRAS